MKHLLTGVAVVVALANAGPVWAQSSAAPMTPPASPPAAAPMTPPAAAPAQAGERMGTRKYMHHVVHNPPAYPAAAAPAQAGERMGTRRYMHRVAHRYQRGHGMSAAQQLNAQELQRIRAGAPPASPPAPMTPYQR